MKEGKRKVIIDAAASIFARDGFDRAKMEDISSQAGIGKGTIYEYFKSKRDLFQEVIKHAVDVYIELLKGIGAEGRPFEEKLADFIQLHKELLEKHRDLANLIMKEPRDVTESTRRYFQSVKKDVVDVAVNLLDSAIQKGEVRDINRRMGAQIILGVTVSLLTAGLMRDEDWDIDDAVDIILHGISK
ncbi:MAG: TetR/AcrR family transcriptional regulator [Thermoanaerobacteraceae bacterium]|nr:TetR/AcrR family transcriptional regulator [Thermoanaerobacteraceae bacterium]